MKKNKGYILMESIVSLSLLVGMTFGYLTITTQLQRQTKQQMEKIEEYRNLYIEIHHQRLYPSDR